MSNKGPVITCKSVINISIVFILKANEIVQINNENLPWHTVNTELSFSGQGPLYITD